MITSDLVGNRSRAPVLIPKVLFLILLCSIDQLPYLDCTCTYCINWIPNPDSRSYYDTFYCTLINFNQARRKTARMTSWTPIITVIEGVNSRTKKHNSIEYLFVLHRILALEYIKTILLHTIEATSQGPSLASKRDVLTIIDFFFC